MSPRRAPLAALIGLLALAACAADPAPRPRPSTSAPALTTAPRAGDGVLSDEETSLLVEEFEVALIRDSGDPQGPTTQTLTNAKMSALNATCVRGARSSEVQSRLVSLLARLQDARALPCFVDTLEHYRPDHTDDDVGQVLLGALRMQLTALAPQVMALFAKVRVHRSGAGELGRMLPDVVEAFARPEHEPELVRRLTARMPLTDDPTYADEFFWQTTAARALGKLRSEQAVQPLITIILDVEKASVAPTATAALTQIGRPAIERVAVLLSATERELRELGAGSQKVGALNMQAITGSAIALLADIGDQACAAPLLAARTHVTPAARVAIARALTQLPPQPANIKAFQELFDGSEYYFYPERLFGKQQIAEAAAGFHDPKLTPWLVKSALGASDSYGRAQSVKVAALVSAMKLMTKDQIPDVRRLLKARTTDGVVGEAHEESWKVATELLAACADRADCYLEALREPITSNTHGNFRHLKAAVMLGVLGDARIRDQLVLALPKLPLPAVPLAVTAIVALSPQGGAPIADAVERFDAKAAIKLRARARP